MKANIDMIRSEGSRRREMHRPGRGRIRLRWEVMERRELLSTFVVSNPTDSASPAQYSLRWAIMQVNQDSTPDTIEIELSGGGAQSIQLQSPLPAITNSVVIDGTMEQGYSGVPLVELDGTAPGSGADGLVISGGQSTVEGLAIVGFSGSAIVLNSRGDNTIAGNYLGLPSSGSQAGGNGQGISIVASSDNTIGGTTAGAGNVISGNAGAGIVINVGSGVATGNQVVGNLIGTDATGSSALGNGAAGIEIVGAAATVIGMPAVGSGNVVAGNLGPGIEITAKAVGTALENNTIGVASNGTTVIGNGGDGILLDNAPSTTVGGTGHLDGNVIGGNQGNGIETGGSTTALVEGNAIGTDATGTLDLANGGSGVQLGSSSNTIGGTSSGASNTIDNNGSGQIGSGVQLVGSVNQNSILSNSIFGNAGLGINLGDGPTPNHAPGTPGPNDYQNYPTLSLAQSDGSTITITGSLYSSPLTTFFLQFFASPSAGESGFGQGMVLVGSDSVTTDKNGNVPFTVPLPADVPPGQYISATATDPSGDTSEFSADVQAKGQINLTLTGTAAPNPVPAGGELTYTLTVTNSGTIAATSVTLSDQLPTNVTVVSASVSQGYLSPSMGTGVTAILGTLPAGGAATLTIVAQTSAGAAGTLTDTATASSGGADSVSTTLTTSIEATADLAVTLTANPSPVLAGGSLTDTIIITNLGPDAASGVSASVPLPQGTSFVSAGPGSATVTSSGGTVSAGVGTMAPNTQVTVTFVVEPTIAGNLEQTATVSSTSFDPVASNNASSVTTPVIPAADLAVTIMGSASTASTINNFTYTVSVTNNGPGDASGVVVSDTLPPGVTLVALTALQGGPPAQSGGVVSWAIGSLDQGATTTMTIEVTPTVAPGSTLVDTASVSGDQADPVPGNDQATLTTPVVGVSDLGISAAAPAGPVYVGQDVAYTLTVSNQGPDLEPGASVTCPMSTAIAFDTASSPSGGLATVKDGILTFDLTPLAAGATTTVTFVLVPQASAAGTLTTGFTVQGVNVDTDSSNNTAAATVTVAPAADLAIAITSASAPPAVNVDWTYTLTVANLGLSDAADAAVETLIPTNVQLESVSDSYQALANGELSIDLGPLAADQTAIVTIVVMPTAVGPQSISASVSGGGEFDPDLANNQASLSATVAPSVALTVALSPTPRTVVAGKPLTLTATVSNAGPNPATDVALDMPMPAGFVYDSCVASQGTGGPPVAGQFVAQLGSVNPGSSATVTLVVTPQIPGTVTQLAAVKSAGNQLDPATATATTTVTVLEASGTLNFGAGAYAVAETSGAAVVSVVRSGGALGAVTVRYQTVAISATPGLDFTPASGTLTFASGQTSATFAVPVLADPWDNHDEYVSLQLSSPGGGATLGSVSTAVLRIIDVDPDTTPPEVTNVSWTGSSKSITGVTLTFSAPLNPTYAANPTNYHLTVPTAGNAGVSLSSVAYNSAAHTITLTPSAPLSSGRFYEVEALGTGESAIRDLAGNLLDGAANGLPGSNYVAYFGQGTKLQYVDNSGNKVSLKLTGGGYLEDVLSAQSTGQVLTLIGEAPHRTALSGTIRKAKGTSGTTNLGTITGLGKFGDVRVSLKSPPFLVKQYPFQQKGRGVL